MEIIRSRIPSRNELWAVFVVIVIPIHIHAYLAYFYEFPAYILRYNIWDTISINAYAQAVALLESVVFLGVFVFLSITLPNRFWRDRFVSQSAIVYLILFFWILPIHHQMAILERLNWDLTRYTFIVLGWSLLLFVLTISAIYILARTATLEERVENLIGRIAPLSILYLGVDLIFLMIILIRIA